MVVNNSDAQAMTFCRYLSEKFYRKLYIEYSKIGLFISGTTYLHNIYGKSDIFDDIRMNRIQSNRSWTDYVQRMAEDRMPKGMSLGVKVSMDCIMYWAVQEKRQLLDQD